VLRIIGGFSQQFRIFKSQKLSAAQILEIMNQAKNLYKSLMEEVSFEAMLRGNINTIFACPL